MADMTFAHYAFNMTLLSAAIQQAPDVPQLLGKRRSSPHCSRAPPPWPWRKGRRGLSHHKTSPRSAPIEEGKGESRRLALISRRSAIARRQDLLYASEAQNIRAFGSTSELQVRASRSWPHH